MPNSINSQNQSFYVQKEASFGVIPNTTGTATVGNSNACRIIKLNTDQDQPLIDRPDKLPTLDYTIGVGGRKNAQWSASMSIAGSGAAGTKPDCDPLLEALFGKAAVVSAGVSVTYATDDTSPSLALWNFRKPSTASQGVAFGAIVKTGKFALGADVATMDFDGESYWVIDTDQFSTAATEAKGGLTAFPAEPAAPVTNGTMVIGFTGAVTLDGNVYTTLRTANINFDAGRELPKDVFNSYFPSTPAQDRRNITMDFSLYDDDGANIKALKNKAITKTGCTLIFQMGLIAGNIWTFTLNNVVLAAPKYDDSQRKYAVNFTGKAHATSATSRDAIQLVIT